MKSIAIISEGISQTSREISLRLSNIFVEIGYDSEIIFISKKQWVTNEGLIVDKNDFSIIKKRNKTFDCAYIYSEGRKTKGYIQGYLSLLEVPYISSSPLATLISTNKYFCKRYLERFNILTPKSLKLNQNASFSVAEINQKIGFPCIVKPNIGTDSYLVEKVENYESLEKSIYAIFEKGEAVLIEEFIEGKEITCGIFSLNGYVETTPVTEVLIYNSPFYNYECKINKHNFKQIPANLTEEQTLKCQEISKNIFNLLECKDFIRIDYILKGNSLYFLETNITPGMSGRSHLPLQLDYMGIGLNYFFDKIIEQNMKSNLYNNYDEQNAKRQ